LRNVKTAPAFFGRGSIFAIFPWFIKTNNSAFSLHEMTVGLCYNKCVRSSTVGFEEGENAMYQIGDQVVYGVHGVCRVVDQEERVIDRKRVTYLALEPVGQDGSRYLVPTHNAAAMSKVKQMLSKEDLTALMDSEEVRSDGWIRDENQRKQTYRELISSGDRVKLMQMVRTLYRHKAAQAAAGRKVHMCDDNFLRDAEKLLTGEVAIVMGIDADQAKQFIRNRLKEDA